MTLNRPSEMPCRLSVVSVNLQSVDLLVLEMYLSIPGHALLFCSFAFWIVFLLPLGCEFAWLSLGGNDFCLAFGLSWHLSSGRLCQRPFDKPLAKTFPAFEAVLNSGGRDTPPEHGWSTPQDFLIILNHVTLYTVN